jgi:hypothetical protein
MRIDTVEQVDSTYIGKWYVKVWEANMQVEFTIVSHFCKWTDYSQNSISTITFEESQKPFPWSRNLSFYMSVGFFCADVYCMVTKIARDIAFFQFLRYVLDKFSRQKKNHIHICNTDRHEVVHKGGL